jgi:hypothetical protein
MMKNYGDAVGDAISVHSAVVALRPAPLSWATGEVCPSTARTVGFMTGANFAARGRFTGIPPVQGSLVKAPPR